jgi:hypothetical protein
MINSGSVQGAAESDTQAMKKIQAKANKPYHPEPFQRRSRYLLN